MDRKPRQNQVGPGVFTIEGVLSERECSQFIAAAEGLGFAEAPINVGLGRTRRVPEHRNNERAMVDDWDLARLLYRRIRSELPENAEADWTLAGLNERFRYYRYRPGQYFRWHHDGSFQRKNGEKSFLSALLYLTDDFEGGATEFDFFDERLEVRPGKGTLLVFEHHLRHQGAPVCRGTKYIARTDVMYRRAS